VAGIKEIVRSSIEEGIESVAWSARGDRLAAGREDGGIKLFAWDGGAGLTFQARFTHRETGVTKNVMSLCARPLPCPAAGCWPSACQARAKAGPRRPLAKARSQALRGAAGFPR
jgi:hypothetical protein